MIQHHFKGESTGQGASQAIRVKVDKLIDHRWLLFVVDWEGCWGSLLYVDLSSERHAGEACWWSTEPHSKINTCCNDPNRNTHPSKPAFIKVVCPTSNYRIIGQPAGQTQQRPLVGCSCPKTHWSLYLVTQVSTHRHTHTLLFKPQTLIYPVLSLPLCKTLYTLLRVWTNTLTHTSQTRHIPG